MKLPNKLIKDFADIINNKSSEKNISNQIQGIVVKKDSDNIYVRLNGSQSLTPVKMGVGAKEGDTVLVSIVDHIATITGNISAPASATIADNYMRYDEEGLAVGKLSNGEPTGTYCLIDPNSTSFSIIHSDNGVLTKFGNDRIDFCSDKGFIAYEGDSMTIAANSPDGGFPSLHLTTRGSSMSQATDVCIHSGGVDVDTFGQIIFNADNGIYAGDTNNNEVVLTAKDIQLHYVLVDVQTSTAANTYNEISVQLEVPDGHHAVGLLQVYSNHRDIFRLTTWGIRAPNNMLRLAWFNAGTKAYTVKFHIYYLTLPITVDHKITEHPNIVVSS